MYKGLLHGSMIRDDYLLTHGGLSKKHGKPFKTIEEASAWINAEFDWYINQPVVPESLSSIFDIGSLRGGYQDVSGIFWCSIGHEKMDIRFNQVVGHTARPEPLVLFEGKGKNKNKHVSWDSLCMFLSWPLCRDALQWILEGASPRTLSRQGTPITPNPGPELKAPRRRRRIWRCC